MAEARIQMDCPQCHRPFVIVFDDEETFERTLVCCPRTPQGALAGPTDPRCPGSLTTPAPSKHRTEIS